MGEACCKSFDEFETISGFKRYADAWNQTDGQIEEKVGQFQQTVKSKHKEKKKVITFCKDKMAQAEREAERESIKKIEEYKKTEKHLLREVNKKRMQANEQNMTIDYTEYEKTLVAAI